MRHGKKINHLGRTHSHRAAMLSNMATSLILHKRINTTVAKAKALRKYVEPLITKSKDDSTHSRRTVFRYLQNKEAVSMLFRDVAQQIASRPGGYTRILKTGNRLGDNADMCMIELVDYNENMLAAQSTKKAKSSRRRGGKKSAEPKSVVPSEEKKVENQSDNEGGLNSSTNEESNPSEDNNQN
jgi:large subunit ribosomal protein L17